MDSVTVTKLIFAHMLLNQQWVYMWWWGKLENYYPAHTEWFQEWRQLQDQENARDEITAALSYNGSGVPHHLKFTDRKVLPNSAGKRHPNLLGTMEQVRKSRRDTSRLPSISF